MAWLQLLVAGLFEVAWAVGMKYSRGLTRPVAAVLTVLSILASLYLLSRALRSIPLGTGYAVWTGIGVAGTALAGMWLFGESRDGLRLLCIGLVIAGILGLKMLTPTVR